MSIRQLKYFVASDELSVKITYILKIVLTTYNTPFILTANYVYSDLIKHMFDKVFFYTKRRVSDDNKE